MQGASFMVSKGIARHHNSPLVTEADKPLTEEQGFV